MSENLAWKIIYTNSDGEKSERMITPRGVRYSYGRKYLSAYCHLRKSYRMFKPENISQILDVSTGEIAENINEVDFFLQNLTGAISIESVIVNDNLEELIVLSYLSGCDGFTHAFEIDVIMQYIMNKYFFDKYDDVALEHVFKIMEPTEHEFKESLKKLRKTGRLNPLIRYLTQLAEADGVVTREESAALLKISEQIVK